MPVQTYNPGEQKQVKKWLSRVRTLKSKLHGHVTKSQQEEFEKLDEQMQEKIYNMVTEEHKQTIANAFYSLDANVKKLTKRTGGRRKTLKSRK